MLLNNGRRALKNINGGNAVSLSVTAVSGATVTHSAQDLLNPCIAGAVRTAATVTTDRYCCVFVGSGNTAAAPTDYALANDISSSLAFVGGFTPGSMQTRTEDSGLISVTATFNNSTNADITVREVGLGVHAAYDTSAPIVLLTRDVLANPVTIPSGEQASFTVHAYISAFN